MYQVRLHKKSIIKKDQTEKLKTVFNGYRYTYNKIIHDINHKMYTGSIKFENLRDRYVTKLDESDDAVYKQKVSEWIYCVPKHIRSEAANDVAKANVTVQQNIAAGNIYKYEFKYKSKSDKKQTIAIPKNCYRYLNGELILCPKYFEDKASFKLHPKGIKSLKKLFNFSKNQPLTIPCNDTRLGTLRLTYSYGKYTLSVPIDKPREIKTSFQTYCGIDQGCRADGTVFGNNGCYEYRGNKEKYKELDLSKLMKLQRNQYRKRKSKLKSKMFDDSEIEEVLLKLQRKISTTKAKLAKLKTNPKTDEKAVKMLDRRIRGRELRRISIRKQNLVDNCHWAAINYLVKSYDVIFCGDLSASSVVRQKKLPKCVKRDLLENVKPYLFRQRLSSKCEELGNKYFLVNESYTSKTCSECGTLHDIGTSKTYTCSICNVSKDRDLQSAKNILMKGLYENHIYSN